ncbi:MAG: hypothetical protein LBE33_11335 [Zoogloeaceae bacterium]|jgi:hypothetical protein|nr:hypothetical protein [Zoogloeaceae bacterium]
MTASNVTASVVAADLDEAADIVAAERPAADWRGFETRGASQAHFAMLHALLSGRYFDEAQSELGLLHAESVDGPWLLRFPAYSVQRLAALDEAGLEAVAEELAATEDFEAGQWRAADALKLVQQMAELADAAAAQGKAIFLWIVNDE